MKTLNSLLLWAGLLAGIPVLAAELPPGPATTTNRGAGGLPANSPTAVAPAAPAPAPQTPLTVPPAAGGTNAPPLAAGPELPAGTNALLSLTNPPPALTNALPELSNALASIEFQSTTNGIFLNFHNAPLSVVLEHLSDAAGFIVNEVASVRGTVDIWSKQPVTPDEAYELLSSTLRKNRLAVVRNNRILTIYALDDVQRVADLSVRTVTRPEDVDPTDEVATWIIPVHYVSASQLLQNLQVLLPLQITYQVNESANSLVMVAPGRDVRRVLKIVNALDTSVSSIASVQVFPLHYADAKAVATEITTLFSQGPQMGGFGGFGGRGGGAQLIATMLRGPGGFGGPGGGFGGGGATGPGSGINPAAMKVTATSDDYSNAVIVSAPDELMKTIEGMINRLDVQTSDITEVHPFHLKHADPSEMADLFTQLFPDTSRTGDTGPGFGLFFGGPGRGFGRGNQATTSDRLKKKSQVYAVADPRTRTLIVSAASELMPHIEGLVNSLDEIEAHQEVVKTFEFSNADPQDVYGVLQDLLNRSGAIRTSSSSTRSSMLGTQNPLTARETSQNFSSSSSTSFTQGFGSSGGGGGGGRF